MPGAAHLYIHIPFCETRCHYCDFFSTARGKDRVSGYIETLRQELIDQRPLLAQLETVYIGGGTPTYIGVESLKELLDAVSSLQASTAEITLEANPVSLDAKMMNAVVAAGVTRISLGVQSFNSELRASLGRQGDGESIITSIDAVRAAGVRQLGLDLLFATPGQKSDDLKTDLELTLAHGPDHVSCYELTVKEGSDFARRWGEELVLARTRAREFYELVSETLEAAGYHWYETSNYARPGCECRHNLAYWRGENYLGIGAGAWSTIGNRRWRNSEDLDEYMEDFRAGRLEEYLSDQQKNVEALMLGLRTSSGVEFEIVAEVTDIDQLELLVQNGFITRDGARISLTRAGRFVANEICSRLLL